jgi:preprotein translocase subunit SecE
MATKEDDKLDDLAAQLPRQEGLVQLRASDQEDRDEELGAEGDRPAQLGTSKYVHAAFFGAGILGAYVCAKILEAVWNNLAEWPLAIRYVPQLVSYPEDERETLTMILGAIIGLLLVVRFYRKPNIKNWANDVASELSRVTWPTKDQVTNGTIVVVVASIVAAVYVAILDRFWGFLTNLVYGV